MILLFTLNFNSRIGFEYATHGFPHRENVNISTLSRESPKRCGNSAENGIGTDQRSWGLISGAGFHLIYFLSHSPSAITRSECPGFCAATVILLYRWHWVHRDINWEAFLYSLKRASTQLEPSRLYSSLQGIIQNVTCHRERDFLSQELKVESFISDLRPNRSNENSWKCGVIWDKWPNPKI